MALIADGRQLARVVEISVGREVTVSGRLDVNTVAEVRLALYGVLDRGAGDLLIHLAQAEIQDATGLGVIVGIHHRARRLGRRLVLVDVSECGHAPALSLHGVPRDRKRRRVPVPSGFDHRECRPEAFPALDLHRRLLGRPCAQLPRVRPGGSRNCL